MDQLNIQEFVNQINSHIANYKELTEGNARAIVEHIKSKVFPLKIKLSFEHLSCIDKIIKIRKEYETNNPDSKIIFKNIQNVNDIVPRFRFLLSTNRYKADFKIPLVKQCNGAIFVIEENNSNVLARDKSEINDSSNDNKPNLICRILSIPPNDFNPKFSKSDLGALMDQGYYTIYEIQDGTTISMYYDNNYIDDETAFETSILEGTEVIKAFKIHNRGKWVYSTKNAFDVSSMICRGFNYKRVIDDVLKTYPMNMDKLSKNKSYSIGIRHPAFHPFGQPKEWVESDFQQNKTNVKWLKSGWFIHSIDLNTMETSFKEDVGLPFQVVIDQSGGRVNLIKKLDTSLKDFINSIKINQHMNNNNKANFSEAFLGLILRSNDQTKTNDLSDILLESALWQEIRKLVYQLPFIQNKTVREKQEQNFKNMTYVILDAFLDFRKRNEFIQVFPQYIHYYARYDTVIGNVVNRMYQELLFIKNNKLRNSGSKDINIHTSGTTTNNNTDASVTDYLFGRLLDVVKSHYQITPEVEPSTGKKGNVPMVKKPGMNRVDKKNIKSLIVNSKYIDIYFGAFHPSTDV